MYDDNDKFDFSSYPKTHPHFTRNIIGYIDVNKPIIYNAKVPANEDFNFKIPIKMGVCKPNIWAVNFHDKTENENKTEKERGKGVPNKLLNMNHNVMILNCV